MTDQTISKEDLVAGLNEDLAHEYQAVLMYTTYSAMANGIHRPMLKQFFQSEIGEELLHAQFLADKITALGGTPTTTPHPVTIPGSTREMLEKVLQAETQTIERYVKRRSQAEAYGDFGLVVDLDEIISDETKHKEETAKLLGGFME
jgi:bacterioferritin